MLITETLLKSVTKVLYLVVCVCVCVCVLMARINPFINVPLNQTARGLL